MARARNIKPGFFESEQVGSVSLGARLMFIALWQLADREGRLEDRPKRIQAYAFRYEEPGSIDADCLLQELLEQKLIDRYEVDGVRVIWIPAFKNHQNPHHREPASELPVKASELRGKPWASPRQASENLGKPEASLGITGLALGKPEASPNLAPTLPQPSPNLAVLNPESLLLNPDGAEVLKPCQPSQAPAMAPQAPQQHEFPNFGADPDPGGLIDELVEDVAQHWPRPGNVPLAKRVWEREASQSVMGVAAWCESTRARAQVHSLAHIQALKANPRHFVPDLARWVYEGDHARPAPKVYEQEPQQRKPRFDPSMLEEPA